MAVPDERCRVNPVRFLEDSGTRTPGSCTPALRARLRRTTNTVSLKQRRNGSAASHARPGSGRTFLVRRDTPRRTFHGARNASYSFHTRCSPNRVARSKVGRAAPDRLRGINDVRCSHTHWNLRGGVHYLGSTPERSYATSARSPAWDASPRRASRTRASGLGALSEDNR